MPDARPTLRLDNAAARRLFLARHGLAERRPAPDVAALIEHLGFVQVDSINTVERAHHMILSARSGRYRPADLSRLLEDERRVFEHWTHDAAVIPVTFFPYWRRRFERDRLRLRERWRRWQGDAYEAQVDALLRRIEATGPIMARDLKDATARKGTGWWDWHPSKAAMEYLWRTGALMVSRRTGFQKVFDLTERVIPRAHLEARPDDAAVIDWACRTALDRLGFATSGEIAAFWATVTPDEAKTWCRTQLGTALVRADVECAGDGACRQVLAPPDLLERAAAAPPAPSRLRVLSPFDPVLRDRARAKRLFGFDYRIEVFVPAPRRRYGYYVFPLLEGDRFVGRIDMRRRAADGALVVRALWPEPGIRFGKGRERRLQRALADVARFAGCGEIDYADGWFRSPL